MSKNENQEIVSTLLEHHRFYINRIWQFFGGILLVNSILLGSIDKIITDAEFLIGITFSAILLIGVFYHLINWTNMRVDRNMNKVNSLSGKINVKLPNSFFAGMINWMKFGILLLTLPHFFLCFRANQKAFIGGIIAFFIMITISEITVYRFKK